MKKRVSKMGELTKKDLAQMLGSLESGLGSKIDNLGKSLDLRITRLESYMKDGFNSLNDKMEYVDARISNQIEGLGRRIDDLADNKISKISYRELENRVHILESRILPRAKK